MNLNWQPILSGNTLDCYTDTSLGVWSVKRTSGRFRCYIVRLNGREEKRCETLAGAKEYVRQRMLTVNNRS